jgi:hypothetical protein
VHVQRLACATALLAASLTFAIAASAGTAHTSAAAQRFTFSEADTSIGSGHKPVVVRVTAVGPISGRGTGVIRTIPAGGRVDHVTLRLPRGSVYVVATDSFAAVHPDLRACKASLVGRGTFRIAGGSGAFHGATGKGTYRRRGTLVGARGADGACLGQKAKPKASYVTISMTGTAVAGGA